MIEEAVKEIEKIVGVLPDDQRREVRAVLLAYAFAVSHDTKYANEAFNLSQKTGSEAYIGHEEMPEMLGDEGQSRVSQISPQ